MLLQIVYVPMIIYPPHFLKVIKINNDKKLLWSILEHYTQSIILFSRFKSSGKMLSKDLERRTTISSRQSLKLLSKELRIFGVTNCRKAEKRFLLMNDFIISFLIMEKFRQFESTTDNA